MKIIYHGSSEHNLKRLEPRKSTHGVYVYATTEKVLALNFSGRCGDDLTYDIGHYDTDENGPWELVENIPGAFDKMFSNSASIYSISNDTFKDINTGFCEVVSEVGVDVIKEEYCSNVLEGLLSAEKEGLVRIYRYPNKPHNFKNDCLNIFDKWRLYRNEFNKDFKKYDFDRFVFLHPSYIEKINELAKEFGYDYHYESFDLVNIFNQMVDIQLVRPEYEQYIDSAYISICSAFPEFKYAISEMYEYYKDVVGNQILKKIK